MSLYKRFFFSQKYKAKPTAKNPTPVPVTTSLSQCQLSYVRRKPTAGVSIIVPGMKKFDSAAMGGKNAAAVAVSPLGKE